MKIYLDTIGCRLNQAEIERYARQFRSAGHDLVASPAQADLAVVNTCAVTAAAASDSRQKIRQLARLGAGELIVTGCWATLRPIEAAALPGVSKVIPNQDKDSLVFDALQSSDDQFGLEPIDRQPIPGARLRTRVFIKVQDGCDNHCTFCVTRLARGAGRSRSVTEILADIRAVIRPGIDSSDFFAGAIQEIVLTGVHLGSWASDFDHPLHLQELVKSILLETDIPRIRLSSIEPWDLNNEFFALWENPRLCRHLHLPLQSGSAATLRQMARKTTPDSYAALVAAARKAIPGVAITTDIITGFPGETEFDHQDSLEFVKSMHFADGHVFPYSPRPGTAAARLPLQVPEFIRKERSAQIREVLAESAAYYQAGFIGEVLDVLWESAAGFGPQGWRLSGLTDNYLRVYAYALKQHWNQITPVYLTSVVKNTMQGILRETAG